jgi:hypothetical protein|tara:strand:- start:13822 stop:14046 length:225 start_codon:yes stop_codon:yes gene_type:complete
MVDKAGNVKVMIKINDCPVRLVREFSTLAKRQYNDTYWVLLQDLIRKAEAYDMLKSDYVKEQEKEPPLTMAGGR